MKQTFIEGLLSGTHFIFWKYITTQQLYKGYDANVISPLFSDQIKNHNSFLKVI